MGYIDGDVITENLYKLYNSLSGEARQAVSRAIDIVTDAEDVDPVHAAGGCYCRECGNAEKWGNGYWCKISSCFRNDSDFCSSGGRKESA